MSDQTVMFDGARVPPPKPKGRKPFEKPWVMHGYGPEGKTCKTCEHHYTYTGNRTWHKCAIWHQSSSAATDIRVSWPACGKYQEETA